MKKQKKVLLFTLTNQKNKTNFLSIKFGFEDNILSWIDYIPASTVKLEDVINTFGTPLSINTKVSKYLDYYDYGDIVISLTKDDSTIYALTQYGKMSNISNSAKGINLPALKDLSTGKLDKLIPGQTQKSMLKTLYPGLKETNLMFGENQTDPSGNNENIETDGPYVYHITKDLDHSEFKRIELVFNSNVLNWIDIVPKKLSLAQALETFGNKYQLDQSNPNVDFYNYKNIVLTVSKKSKIILNIGILGSVNAGLREVLVPWTELNSKKIKNIDIGSTTETQFNKNFTALIAQKQTEGNMDIFKVVDGISSRGYSSIYFVFKGKKLTSVDFIIKSDINVSEVIKAYGEDYEIDTKSDTELAFYTFKNVIVSVLKDSKIVNSIGLF